MGRPPDHGVGGAGQRVEHVVANQLARRRLDDGPQDVLNHLLVHQT